MRLVGIVAMAERDLPVSVAEEAGPAEMCWVVGECVPRASRSSKWLAQRMQD